MNDEGDSKVFDFELEAERRSGKKKRSDRQVKIDSSTPLPITDFYAYMPKHRYLHVPSRELWPAASVNARVLQQEVDGQLTPPSVVLDATRAIEQLTWAPGEPQIITGRVIDQGGWSASPAAAVFNLYRAPSILPGAARLAQRWRDHLRVLWPEEAGEIEQWVAHRLQYPGEKTNHALLLAGAPGVGKDTLLEPVKAGVGAWNWSEISPGQMVNHFSGWARAVVVRVSEAHDLGDLNRFSFYEHSKVYCAAPPDVLRVNEKYLAEYYLPNCLGLLLTSNYSTDAIYLPGDDRRHLVASSSATKEQFGEEYWLDFWSWYEQGGIGDVVAFLRELDLSAFNPKAPPRRTAGFWAIVQASSAPEDSEMKDLLDEMERPNVVTLVDLVQGAELRKQYGLREYLSARANRRQIPHRLREAGYVGVHNSAAKDGQWVIEGRRQAVYGLLTLTYRDQCMAIHNRWKVKE